MADVHDIKTRSYNMSQIKSKDTKPELLVRKFLFAKGLRYRLHNKELPGKPDLVFRKYQTALFINGCFWHGHNNCKYFVMPKTRTEWWQQKIEETIERDKSAVSALLEMGWTAITLWECELKPKKRNSALNKLYNEIKSEKE